MKLTIEAELGIRIRYLRKVRKLSIEELAFKSGVNKNYLGDLERGTRNPTLKILEKIANGLQITLSDLLKGIKGIN
jgi:transcriptional regulator with XRE-family HTH domain